MKNCVVCNSEIEDGFNTCGTVECLMDMLHGKRYKKK